MGTEITQADLKPRKLLSNDLNQNTPSKVNTNSNINTNTVTPTKLNYPKRKMSIKGYSKMANLNYCSSSRNHNNQAAELGDCMTFQPSGFKTNKNKSKEKIVLVAKNKVGQQEKKALVLVQKNNDQKKDFEMISKTLDSHLFMQTLNDQARSEIITTMSLCRLDANKVLFNKGDMGCYWYIVSEGTLGQYDGNVKIKEFKKGDSFGDHALMNDVPRNHTVKSLENCMLWVLKQEAFRKILEYISQVNYESNIAFLNHSCNLPIGNDFKILLANNLVDVVFKKDDIIFREGDKGNCMYLIKKGEVRCEKNSETVRILSAGDNMGQKAILSKNENRSLTCVAHTDCVLCSIPNEFFKSQLGENYKEYLIFEFIVLAFSKSKYFNSINEKMLLKALDCYIVKNYGRDEVIFSKGEDLHNKLCVVLEGSIYNKTLNKTEAQRYQFLYEEEMYKITPSQPCDLKAPQDLIANPDCLVAIFDYEAFKNKLGGNMKKIEKQSNEMASLENIQLFKILSDEKKEMIQKKLKVETFENGKRIIVQGETGDKFYIIKKGRVDFFINSKYIRSLGENEEFGAKSLIISEKRSATAIANGTVQCYTLTSKIFKSLLEPTLIEYFQSKFYLEDNTIELRDLDNIKELGKGNYGFVNLVKSRKNKQLYAIKALSLKQIKKEKLEVCVNLEKDVLLKVDHPFIMKMVKYFKNDNFIFFLFEYIHGKDLWEVIREIGLLNTYQIQFYGASLMLAIEYLHKKKIIYRDIKPENVMVSDKGYIKIIDFGTVKEIKERTNTFIGTPQYMAPELIKGEGYSFEVDIWSIAICMYEFACGKVPFGDDIEEPMEVYKLITKSNLEFPSFIKDESFKILLDKMLRKNPLDRLCKVSQIRNDVYFRGFDWDMLAALALKPAYYVKISDINDTKNVIPYLTVVNMMAKNEHFIGAKRKVSERGREFNKWYNNF